jgi:hypothetical protein
MGKRIWSELELKGLEYLEQMSNGLEYLDGDGVKRAGIF